MEHRYPARVASICVFLAMLIVFYSAKLYDIQVINRKQNADSADTFTYTTRVTAARGEILDRNGNVLVTNRASYNLVLINAVLFSSDSPNENLRTLANLCKEKGYEFADHLPITEQKPYEYTLDEYSSTWQSNFRSFLEYYEWDPDISAAQLVKLLREEYNLPDSWTEEEQRMVMALRYELDLRVCTYEPTYVLMSDVSSEELSTIMELGIPGLNVESTTVREYKTEYAAHILGMTGAMNAVEYEYYEDLDYPMDAYVGKDGLEKAFEEQLHGIDGYKQTTLDADGTLISETYTTQPVAGNNVELTIDIDLQTAAEKGLRDTILDLQENGVGRDADGKDADAGAIVVVECNSGDILASASYPTFNPTTYYEDFNKLKEQEPSPYYNRALQGTYSPGSVFKMVTAIAAINNNVVGRYYGIEDEGVYTHYADNGFVANCYYYTSYGLTHGVIDTMEALAVSCNYYFYEIGRLTSEKVGWDAVDKVAKDLGLGEPTGVELYEEIGTRANAETKEKLYGEGQQGWYSADVLMASIGQSENKFTPLQLGLYTAALANGGTRYKATFLKRIVSNDYKSLVYENSPQVMSKCYISDEALAAVHEGMRMGVTAENGTSHGVFGDYEIPVSGKTGTVQTDLSIAGVKSDSCSYVCYAPADNPQIAIAIYVENGAQGGNLANIARAIMDVYFAEGTHAEPFPAENTIG